MWRRGRRLKEDVNRDFTEFEGQMFGDLGVECRMM